MARNGSPLPAVVLTVMVTATATVMAPAMARAATEATAWATADGSSPGHFENHVLGHDDPLGPNDTFAVGRWSGPTRHGSYAGFELPTQAWVPTRAQVLLAGYMTGPVHNEYLWVSLDTAQGTYGPLTLAAARLNEHVGGEDAGTWVMDFSLFYDLPAGALQGGVEVDIKLMSHGPGGGSELYLDAVGMDVRLENPDESFDLWLGNDAAVLDGQASYRQGIDSPVDLDGAECPFPICYLRVRDGAGEDRTLSVLPLADGTTFRVSFADGRADAPVDADLSQVAAPATAVADGVSLVQARITPRDGDGLPLGEGIVLRLDPASLHPAEAVGGFTHQGDGSFVILLKSATAGDARLVVQADGVTLSQAPVIRFVAP